MLIECLTLRDGLTIVSIKEHNYEFMPIPGALEGEQTTSVCNIANQEIVDYLVGNMTKNPPIKGRANFRPYRPKQAQDDMLARRNKIESTQKMFTGYSVDVLKVMGNDKGYCIKHREKDGSIKFCGANGIWSDDVQKVWPFVDINDADVWLRSFVENKEVPAPIIDKTPYHCAECKEVYGNPVDLAKHWEASHQKENKDSFMEKDLPNPIEKTPGRKEYQQIPKG
jgi:hypothetical protein